MRPRRKACRQATEPHGDEGGDRDSSSSEEEPGGDHGVNNALSIFALEQNIILKPFSKGILVPLAYTSTGESI